jgi:hypothetical protein
MSTLSTPRDQVEDILLALIQNHGKHLVTEAATRTLPVITFAESNEAIGRLKDDACATKDELAKVKETNTILYRLIANLEGEVKRQAKELKDKALS